MRWACLLVLLAATAGAQPRLRKDFDLFLERQGVGPVEWTRLEETDQQALLEAYLETLAPEKRKDKDLVSLLGRLKNPELARAALEGSALGRGELDTPGHTVPAAAGTGGGPAEEASRAAGLSVLQHLRPGALGPPQPPGAGGPKAALPPAGPPASLAGLGASEWGRELLQGVGPDMAGSEGRAWDGMVLRVEYGDLGKRRGATDVLPDSGLYRVVIDSRLRGSIVERAVQAHELSHVRDLVEHPEARPETLGLLMEHRAALYEVAVYLEARPGILQDPRPEDFYEAELWYKARILAAGADEAFMASLPLRGVFLQMRRRTRLLLDACAAGRVPCGGPEALYAAVVDPSYKGSKEASILDLEREAVPADRRWLWDRAWTYRERTRAFERTLMSRYGAGGGS